MYKLTLDSFQETFSLIGISSNLEGFKIAYLINKKLGFNFYKPRQDILMKHDGKVLKFEIFKFYHNKTESTLYLVQNKSSFKKNKKNVVNALFDMDETINKYLINSHKQAEYLIKIEDDFGHFYVKSLVSSLNEIPHLVSAFEIPFEDLKTPENLIF